MKALFVIYLRCKSTTSFNIEDQTVWHNLATTLALKKYKHCELFRHLNIRRFCIQQLSLQYSSNMLTKNYLQLKQPTRWITHLFQYKSESLVYIVVTLPHWILICFDIMCEKTTQSTIRESWMAFLWFHRMFNYSLLNMVLFVFFFHLFISKILHLYLNSGAKHQTFWMKIVFVK